MLLIGIFCFFIRSYAYTLLTVSSAKWILAIEVLHGISYGMNWSAMIEYTKSIYKNAGKDKWATTFVSITGAAYQCIGIGIGCFLGGWIFDTYGARSLYKIYAYLFAGLFVTHLVLFLADNMKKNSYKILEE